MATHSKSDVLFFFATAIYRASRPVSQRTLMDAREITSFKELNRVALSFQSVEPEKPVVKVSSPTTVFRGVQCYVCRRYGHRSFDCRYRSSSQTDVSSNKVPPVVCYSCNEPGYKEPECPNRGRNFGNNKSDKNEYKKVDVKKGSSTYNTNWVAVQDGDAHVEGIVNGLQCQIVPDTGAETTIVPGCLVYENQLLDEFVRVRGWNGEPKTLQTARVDFEFGGKSFMSTVAVAHENNLCNKVLFSVPMDGNMASKLILDAASNAPPRAGEAEHPGDTPGIQIPADAGAGSVAIPQEACKTSQGVGNTQRSVTVSVVTRSMSKKESNEKSTDNV